MDNPVIADVVERFRDTPGCYVDKQLVSAILFEYLNHPQMKRRVAVAVWDPSTFVSRGDNYEEPLYRWQERAVTRAIMSGLAPIIPVPTPEGAHDDYDPRF